jgi:hypothetical protein
MDCCFGAAACFGAADCFGFTWTSGFPPTVGGLPWAIAAAEYNTKTSANIILMSPPPILARGEKHAANILSMALAVGRNPLHHA